MKIEEAIVYVLASSNRGMRTVAAIYFFRALKYTMDPSLWYSSKL